MSALVHSMDGFIDESHYSSPDGERVTVVRFVDKMSQQRWATQPDHVNAQRRGREEFYAWYDISSSEESYHQVFEHTEP